MKRLCKLYQVEEKIESCFIHLAQLEINGEKDSLEYNRYVGYINELNDEEKKILGSIDLDTLIKYRKKVKKDNFNINNDKPIALGFLTNAYYFRLENILKLQLGDDLFDYENVLRYDINQILFSFLEYMINNEYYEDIREDLIFYKYNQIFLNVNSEYDFITLKDVATVNLETNNSRTDEFPSYEFVDKTVLVLESIDFNAYITNAKEDFKNYQSSYAIMVISIINVLARLILCKEDMIDLVYDDIRCLLEDETVYESIKEIINEMFNILEIIREQFVWAR